MALGKKLKELKDLKKQGIEIVNEKAYINFHTGPNGRRTDTDTDVPQDPPPKKGRYIKASLIAFHDEYDIEHDSLDSSCGNEYCIDDEANNGGFKIDFKKTLFSNDSGKTKMKVLQQTIWVHESMSGKPLLFRVYESKEKVAWDTKYCETIVPRF